MVNGKVYRTVQFGLSTYRWVFTKVLEPVAVFLHHKDVTLQHYVDDMLIRSPSKEQCLQWTLFTLALLFKLGPGVSLEKSDLVPAQNTVPHSSLSH